MAGINVLGPVMNGGAARGSIKQSQSSKRGKLLGDQAIPSGIRCKARSPQLLQPFIRVGFLSLVAFFQHLLIKAHCIFSVSCVVVAIGQ